MILSLIQKLLNIVNIFLYRYYTHLSFSIVLFLFFFISSSENVIMTGPKSDCLGERLLLVHNCIQDNSPWQEQVHLISH